MMLEIENIDKPFREVSQGSLAVRIKSLGTGMINPFIILTDRAKLWTEVLSRQMPWVVKTEKALQSFKERMDKVKETKGLYLNIREAQRRTPSGYITDIRVIIPDSNREIEYQVYDAFGELLRTSSPLLFDLHIIKLRGRKLEEAIPDGFWRYGWTSNYIF